jgi:hypothetical protein
VSTFFGVERMLHSISKEEVSSLVGEDFMNVFNRLPGPFPQASGVRLRTNPRGQTQTLSLLYDRAYISAKSHDGEGGRIIAVTGRTFEDVLKHHGVRDEGYHACYEAQAPNVTHIRDGALQGFGG